MRMLSLLTWQHFNCSSTDACFSGRLASFMAFLAHNRHFNVKPKFKFIRKAYLSRIGYHFPISESFFSSRTTLAEIRGLPPTNIYICYICKTIYDDIGSRVSTRKPLNQVCVAFLRMNCFKINIQSEKDDMPWRQQGKC